MRIGRITRKLLMNWYALGFTAIFTLGLTGAAGLTTSRKTSFQKDKAKQALPFSLPVQTKRKLCPSMPALASPQLDRSVTGESRIHIFVRPPSDH